MLALRSFCDILQEVALHLDVALSSMVRHLDQTIEVVICCRWVCGPVARRAIDLVLVSHSTIL